MRFEVLLAAAALASAQTKVDIATQTKNVDFSAAASTKPARTGTELPAVCSVGEIFFKTSSAPGGNLFTCASPNTWSAQAVGVAADGVLVGVRPSINLIAGPGIQSVLADTGSQVNVESHVDTTVMQWEEQAGRALLCASNSGDPKDYRCGLTPVAVEYVAGMLLHWVPDVGGAGGATTLNVDALGAVPVKLSDGLTDPAAGDIVAGRMALIWHDGSRFRMLPAGGADGGGAVSSVFGRTGAVTAQTGDYSFAQLGGSLSAAQIAGAGTLSNSTTGNAATATALAATPAKCGAGSYPLGVDAQGNAQNCTQAATGGGGGTPGGSNGQIQINASGAFGGITLPSSGLLKGAAGPTFAQAVSGSDYAPPTSGTALLKGNGAGGFNAAAPGTDYAPATTGTALLKGNGSGGFNAAAAGTEYIAPNSAVAGTIWSSTNGLLAPVTTSASGPVTMTQAGFYFANAGSTAITYSLPAITAALVGARFCVRNIAGATSAITLQAPASTFIDLNGANGSAAGTLVSSGALGDNVCVLAVSTTQYAAYTGAGAWSNN